MKITIQEHDGKKLSLLLPTFLLKSKLVTKFISKYSDDSKIILDITPKIYKILKQYIRENGHFVLVDIISNEGDKVYIKV